MQLNTWLMIATVVHGVAGCTESESLDGGDRVGGKADEWDEASGTCDAWRLPPSHWPTFEDHTATRLHDGRVLVVGKTTSCGTTGCATSHAALFDPQSDSWTMLPAAPPPLVGRTATLLQDRRVLLVGGIDDQHHVVSTVVAFDPVSMQFSAAAAIPTARAFHASALLPDGRLLVTGGRAAYTANAADLLSSVQVFDPTTQLWSNASSMLGPRQHHTATVVDGWVAVVGGVAVTGGVPRAATTTEAYYPPGDQWMGLGELAGPAVGHTTTALSGGGQLLVVSDAIGAVTKTWHSHWYPTGAMQWPRSRHVAVRLRDGRVLVAGGSPYQSLRLPEIYDPETLTWSSSCEQPADIWDGSATLLNDDRVLIISSKALVFQVPPAL